MKTRTSIAHLLVTFCLATSGSASSQINSMHEFPDGGWGEIEAPKETISEAEQQAWWQTIQGNIESLRRQGKLPELKADLAVRFSWPTKFALGRPELHDHAVANYIDQDPAVNSVKDFYNKALNHYFRTAAQAEAQSLTPASGLLPTGDDFFALDRTVSLVGGSPVCRFYGSPDPGPNSHFYTAEPAECAALKKIQATTPATVPRWNYEEIAFAAYLPVAGVCPTDAPFPVYRLYNQHAGETVAGKRADSNHRFTTLSSVYNHLGLSGWRGEGVVMCAESKP